MPRTPKTIVAAAVAAALLALPALAGARVLASGFMTSSNTLRLGCRVQNVGTTAVVITSAKVVTDTGLGQTDFQDCVGTLQPGKACSFTGPGNLLSGVLRVDGSTRGLRGVCTILGQGNNAINSIDMR